MKRILIFLIVVMTALLFTGCESNNSDGNSAPGVPQFPVPLDYATSVGNVAELSWTCEDADGDALTYTVYLGGEDDLQAVASDISDTFITLDSLDYSKRYYWKIKASDGKETTAGAQWRFNTVEENVPPTTPASPIPADSLIDTSVEWTFRWYSYDINGDDVTYDFCLGKDDNPPVIAQNLSEMMFEVTNLDYHTYYYWKVISHSADMTTVGPVWCFETRYYNYPPEIPHTPFPYNESTDIQTNTRLSWNCSDEEDDDLTYDIYLGTETNPQLIVQGFSSLSYYPDSLEALTTYYWRVDAWDGNNYSHGPIWEITTGDPNNPPNVPYMPRPVDEAEGESIYAMLRWSCSDPDGDDLMYKVYFGITEELTEDDVIAIGITDENWGLGTLFYGTTYYWKVTAHDGEMMATSETWSFTTETFRTK